MPAAPSLRKLTALAASVAGLLSAATITLAPPARAQIPGGVVAVAQLEFVTRYRTASGAEIARHHPAVPLVPTPLNVDEDLEPDLLGLVAVRGPNEIEVTILKLPTEPRNLPVEVLAVANDPSGALPRKRVAFGYDARAAGAPANFAATVGVPLVAAVTGGATPRIEAIFSSESRPRMALVGRLFNGDALTPTDVIGGRLLYTPMPTGGSLFLEIDQKRYSARVTHTEPGLFPELQATFEYNHTQFPEVNRNKLWASALIDELPPQVTIDYTDISASTRTLVVNAARETRVRLGAAIDNGMALRRSTVDVVIDKLPAGEVRVQQQPGSVRYSAPPGPPIREVKMAVRNLPLRAEEPRNLDVTARGVPSEFTLMDGTGGFAGFTTPQSLGSVDFRLWGADAHEPMPAPTNRNVFELRRQLFPQHFSARGHIEHLQTAALVSLDRPARKRLDLKFAVPDPLPISYLVRLGNLQVGGTITDPPRWMNLTVEENLGPKITWFAARAVREATLRVGVQKPGPFPNALGAHFRLWNIPTFMTFCATGEQDLCDHDAPNRFKIDPPGLLDPDRTITLENDVTMYLRGPSSAGTTFVADGIICLPSSRIDDVSDDRCMQDIAVVESHPRLGSLKYVRLRNVRARDLDFEIAVGDSVEREGSDCHERHPRDCDPVEDDLVKLWMDFAQPGLLFDEVRYQAGWPNAPGKKLQLYKPSAPEVRARNAFLVLDVTQPGIEFEQFSAKELSCRGLAGRIWVGDLATHVDITPAFARLCW